MTKSSWKISEAKARLSELVHACEEGPQVLYNRGKPVAAMIDMESFRALEHTREQSRQPSVATLLDELDALNAEEGDFGDPPERADRPAVEL